MTRRPLRISQNSATGPVAMETERTSSDRSPWDTPRGTAWAIGFGAVDIVSAVVVYVAVFEALPTRYLPIDAAATAVILLLGVAGVGLVAKKSWATMVAQDFLATSPTPEAPRSKITAVAAASIGK